MIWAWIGAAAVGLSLGLLGSGGAILTVPILVYLVGHDEKTAIVESLAIVGAIAAVGAARAGMLGRVDFRSAAWLAGPGVLGTIIGAHVAKFVPGAMQLGLLAVLMVAASFMMFRKGGVGHCDEPDAKATRGSLWVLGVQGVGLGVATGLVGVGGGFLIVPVLVLLRRLTMPVAVGTSLAIIMVNCCAGFLKYSIGPAGWAGVESQIDWGVIGVFVALGVGGSLVGGALAGRIQPLVLKRAFAVFLVVMAGYIFWRQVPRIWPGVRGSASGVALTIPVELGTPEQRGDSE